MNTNKIIMAIGGAGFSTEPDNLLLEKYLFSLSSKPRPKVCFVGTASGDAESYIERFYSAMKSLEAEPSHLALYKGPLGSLKDYVFEKDIIYVGGGNTKNLLTLWREWDLDKILKEAYLQGIILAGVSAGSICWFEEGVTDSIPGTLSKLTCLGILKGSNCPHYDGEKERRPAYHRLISTGMKNGYACDDGVAAVYENETLKEFVSSRSNAMAYRVSLNGSQIIEEPIKPRLL